MSGRTYTYDQWKTTNPDDEWLGPDPSESDEDVKTVVESPKRKLDRELREHAETGEIVEDTDPMQSGQIDELAAALAKAQGVMENAVMNRINPHFKSKYADHASVLDATRGPLSANGLAVTQLIREGGKVLRTILMHTSGQWLASEYPLPATARPQEMGSALTYARRYSYAAIICNSADEDDDGEGAEARKQKPDTNGSARISDKQNQELQARIANLGVDIPTFKELMKVQKIADLPASKFAEAMRELDEFEAYQNTGKK